MIIIYCFIIIILFFCCCSFLYDSPVRLRLCECAGVMTELSNLMSHVAEQTSGASGPQWQHPSDLTRRYAVPVLSACIVRWFSNRKPLLTGRNYQRRFGNSNPSVSLREWQASSSKAGKRFETVPRTFRTSPVD